MTLEDLPDWYSSFKKDAKDRNLLEDFIVQFQPDNDDWSIIFRKMLVEIVNTYRED